MGTLVQRDPTYHIQQMLGALYFLVLIFPSKDNDHIVVNDGNPNYVLVNHLAR